MQENRIHNMGYAVQKRNDFISIVIPAWNEKNRLPNYLNQWLVFLPGKFDEFEIIIVDDGSSDGLFEELIKRTEYGKYLFVLRRKHEGKGAAVKAGMLKARGDIVLFCDADGASPVEECTSLYNKHVESGAPIIIASRNANSGANSVKNSFFRHFIGRIFRLIVTFLTDLRFYDTQCGFKLFTSHAVRMIFPKVTTPGWAFDIEVLLWAKKFGLPVFEVPVSWHGMKDSRTKPFRDALPMLLDVIRIKRLVGRP